MTHIENVGTHTMDEVNFWHFTVKCPGQIGKPVRMTYTGTLADLVTNVEENFFGENLTITIL